MAAAVEATLNLLCRINETFALGVDGVTDPSAQCVIEGTTATLNASSTPPVTKAYFDNDIQLTAGALTLNFASMARGNLTANDMTGLKLQGWAMSCPATNTAGVTVTTGASNGYDWLGASDGKFVILPGEAYAFKGDDEQPDVASGARTIDFASGDTDATIRIAMVFG